MRITKAFDNFLRKDAKYPKIKKYKDCNSISFPQFGLNKKGHRYEMSFSANGKLYNTQLGEVDILLHNALEGKIKHEDGTLFLVSKEKRRRYLLTKIMQSVLPLDSISTRFFQCQSGIQIRNTKTILPVEIVEDIPKKPAIP